ncbi:MAG: MATE family efflux transporter [Oscillospiraceae bacterium]|nr:MATE family efflux transporter [Oscillospiraceae bacterium]
MTDLTTGKPSKVILNFSLPLLLSTALQQAYNIADSIIVGQYTGQMGLASIGSAYPITLLFVAVATGASMGCSVVISQLFGSKNMERVKTAISTSLISLSAVGILLALLGILLAGPIMRLINTSDIYFDNAVVYLKIYSVGVIPMMVYNAANAIYTGLGDSKSPLYFLLLSSVLHIILVIIAVGPMEMGVAGAAWATTISQVVAAVLTGLFVVKKVRTINTENRPALFDISVLGKMGRIGLPAIFQQACVAFAHTIVQSLVNTFDTYVVAGYEISNKINTVLYSSMNTLGTALSSYVAQCYGAGKFRRIKEGFKVSYLMVLGVSIFFIAVCQLFPSQIMSIFVKEGSDPGVIEVGVNYLRIITPVYLLITVIITTGGLLRGLGHSMTFFLETITEFAVRVSMCFVLVKLLGNYTGVMWAWYFGSSVGCGLCLWLYARTMRREVIPNI